MRKVGGFGFLVSLRSPFLPIAFAAAVIVVDVFPLIFHSLFPRQRHPIDRSIDPSKCFSKVKNAALFAHRRMRGKYHATSPSLFCKHWAFQSPRQNILQNGPGYLEASFARNSWCNCIFGAVSSYHCTSKFQCMHSLIYPGRSAFAAACALKLEPITKRQCSLQICKWRTRRSNERWKEEGKVSRQAE